MVMLTLILRYSSPPHKLTSPEIQKENSSLKLVRLININSFLHKTLQLIRTHALPTNIKYAPNLNSFKSSLGIIQKLTDFFIVLTKNKVRLRPKMH